MEAKNIITSLRLEQRQYDELQVLKERERKSMHSLILDAIDLLIAQKKEQA